MPDAPTILLIEDEVDLVDLLRIHLTDMGFRVEASFDGLEGLQKVETGDYALVVLDVMLPGLDGLEICKRIRGRDPHLPILMLTARSDELDRVLGLELGADDYLTKPFSVRELIARIKALFRRIDADRQRVPLPEGTLHYGPLTVELAKRRALLDGRPLELTAKEWELLSLFAQNPGRVYTRQELLDLVWGYQYDGYSHTVNSHINRLRGKIEEDPSLPRYIVTRRGLGYRFAEPGELEASA